MYITIDDRFYSALLEDARLLHCKDNNYDCMTCPFNKHNHNFDAQYCTELTDEQLTIIMKKIYKEEWWL